MNNRLHYLLLFILYLSIAKIVEGVKPYQMTTVYIDRLDGSTCKPHEFTKIRGLGGYIISHDDSSLPTYKAGQQCFLIIEAPEHYQIAVEAMQFDLGYESNEDKCQGDSLFLFDNQPEDGKIFDSNLDMLREYCTTVSNQVPYTLAVSSNNSITLYWHAAELAQRRLHSKGFKLKWFVMKRTLQPRRPDNAPMLCNLEADFMCSNEQACIPLELACDAETHCTDGSDVIRKRQLSAGCENIESDTFLISDLSSGAVAALAAATATFTLLTLGLLARCCCRNSTGRHCPPSCTSGNGSPASSSFKSTSTNGAVTNIKSNSHHQPRNCYQPAPTTDLTVPVQPHYYAAQQPHTFPPLAQTGTTSSSGSGGCSRGGPSPPAPPPPSDAIVQQPTVHHHSVNNFIPPDAINSNIGACGNASTAVTSPLTMQNLHNFNNNRQYQHATHNQLDNNYYGDPSLAYHHHQHHHYNKPKGDHANYEHGHQVGYTEPHQYDYSAVKDFV